MTARPIAPDAAAAARRQAAAGAGGGAARDGPQDGPHGGRFGDPSDRPGVPGRGPGPGSGSRPAVPAGRRPDGRPLEPGEWPDAQQVQRFQALLEGAAEGARDAAASSRGAAAPAHDAPGPADAAPPKPPASTDPGLPRHDRDDEPAPPPPPDAGPHARPEAAPALPSPMALFTRAAEPAAAPPAPAAPGTAAEWVQRIAALAVTPADDGRRRVRIGLAEATLPGTEVEVGEHGGVLEVHFFCRDHGARTALAAQAPALAAHLAERLQREVRLGVGTLQRDDAGRTDVHARPGAAPTGAAP